MEPDGGEPHSGDRPGDPIRLAINGFGRIGRHILRRALAFDDVEVVAVNNHGASPDLLAYLFRNDSVLGRYTGEVRAAGGYLFVDGRAIALLSEDDPERLPWAAMRVEVAAEATGRLTTGAQAALHRRAGARKVLITAPARGVDTTVVLGANEASYEADRHHVVSGASCTTACLAPMAKLLHEAFGIVGGLMTTVHAYTRDQELLDGTNADPRRARAAALNLAPTRTGAARAIGTVVPDLAGRLVGIALRVPVPAVSIVDLNVRLERPATTGRINELFETAGAGPLAGILGVCDEPLVSSDFIGDSRSCIVDLPSTRGAPDGQFKVLAWYDNEWAYACRMVDLARLMAGRREPLATTQAELAAR